MAIARWEKMQSERSSGYGVAAAGCVQVVEGDEACMQGLQWLLLDV